MEEFIGLTTDQILDFDQDDESCSKEMREL
jgi:hypothetical protein